MESILTREIGVKEIAEGSCRQVIDIVREAQPVEQRVRRGDILQLKLGEERRVLLCRKEIEVVATRLLL